MGKRKGRKNNSGGGGNKVQKNRQNKQNSSAGNSQALVRANKFPPGRNAAESNGDDDNFFASEIVREVVGQAIFEYMLGRSEFDEEDFLNYFAENFMGELLVKCAKNQRGNLNEGYGFDESSDDEDGIDIEFRYGNIDDDEPFFAYQRMPPPKRKKKIGRYHNPVAIAAVAKMLAIHCMIEEEKKQRNKRFRLKMVLRIFFLIIVCFFIYYWWK